MFLKSLILAGSAAAVFTLATSGAQAGVTCATNPVLCVMPIHPVGTQPLPQPVKPVALPIIKGKLPLAPLPVGPVNATPIKFPVGPIKGPIQPIIPVTPTPIKFPVGPIKGPIQPIIPINPTPIKFPVGPIKGPIQPIIPVTPTPIKFPVGPIKGPIQPIIPINPTPIKWPGPIKWPINPGPVTPPSTPTPTPMPVVDPGLNIVINVDAGGDRGWAPPVYGDGGYHHETVGGHVSAPPKAVALAAVAAASAVAAAPVQTAITCSQVQQQIGQVGFYDVSLESCGTANFVYSAKLFGADYVIDVASTGSVSDVIALPL